MGMDPNNLNKPPNKKKNKEGEVSIDKTPKKDRINVIIPVDTASVTIEISKT